MPGAYKLEKCLERPIDVPLRFVAPRYGCQEALDRLWPARQGRAYLDKWVKPVLVSGNGGLAQISRDAAGEELSNCLFSPHGVTSGGTF